MTGTARSLRELMDLSGRVVLITGGAGYVAAEAAAAVAELGAAVFLADREGDKAEALAELLASRFDVATRAATVDLTDEEDVRALPGRAVQSLGGLNVIINAAALVSSMPLEGWAVPFEQQSLKTWREAVEVNLTSTFVLAQSAAPMLRQSESGSIINISSIYGMVGPDMSLYEGTKMGNPAAYAASKGGLLQVTRWLATVLAPRVRVNAIAPGGILRGQPEPFVTRYEERTPLGRMGREEDLKGAIAYLASDLSAYVTGHNLVVDGGWTSW